MLCVAAHQVSYPVANFVLVKSGDLLFQKFALRLVSADPQPLLTFR